MPYEGEWWDVKYGFYRYIHGAMNFIPMPIIYKLTAIKRKIELILNVFCNLSDFFKKKINLAIAIMRNIGIKIAPSRITKLELVCTDFTATDATCVTSD